MGIDSSGLQATLRVKSAIFLAIPAVLALLAAPAFGQRQSVAQKKNARPSPALRENLPEPDELPLRPEDIEERKREEARAALISQMRAQALAEVNTAARSVRSADLRVLAKALRVEISMTPDPRPENSAASAFKRLADLDGDGSPEAVFRWSRPERFRAEASEEVGPLPGWILYLFSWDGTRWRVTEMMTGDGLCGLDTLSGIWPSPAVVAAEGLSNVPYPVIFRFQNHGASVAWDSRDAESRYQGYAQGVVQFDERESGPPVMIVSGRADPGVIRFSPNGKRGFEAATVYFWEGGAYVPKKTEFAENEDYALYRFLSALHLRDFRTAFSLVEPGQFLRGSDKTVDGFRKHVEENWREFTGNTLFEAVEDPESGENQFAFAWNRDDTRFVYLPQFSSDGRFLLIGLERREVK